MDAETDAKPKAESLNVLCAICNEFYKANDVVYSTSSCGHVFHRECLFRWLSRSQSCPQCRAACHQQRVHRLYMNFAKRTEFDEVETTEIGEEEPLERIQWVPIDLSDPLTSIDLEGAVQCGTDHEGFNTYVARVRLHYDLLPANFVPEKRAVYAPWDQSAHRLNTEVELLILKDCELKWEQKSHGNVPWNALETGYAEGGEVLYTGRTIHEGRMLLGKVHPSHMCLFYPTETQELRARSYEVLVVTPKE
ncbi:uncharacterized protein LOC117782883 [Drosophila innubila]|uniref:uncharacterized protein LOC117782883 n=1 Tax=Drosophila innubila TaxID=198719 RepID=UPI00148E6353|nr:uncharacterized protein LOC117782883 [Drosophila innubila]